MLKSILGTAVLLAGWSLFAFYYPMFLGANHVSILKPCPDGGCQIVGTDDGTRGIVIWVIGLVAIVAFRVWLYRRRSR